MSDLHPPLPEPPTNGGGGGGAPSDQLLPGLGSKRQRRPSVRLGDIGEQPAAIPYEPPSSFPHRRSKPPSSWKFPKDHKDGAKPSSKTRPLTNLDDPASSADDRALLPVDENLEPLSLALRRPSSKIRRPNRRIPSAWTSAADPKSDDPDDGYRDDSVSPRVRPASTAPAADLAEGEIPSETDGGDWNEQNGRCEDGGLRSWLDRLGLGRYAPVFEIHEVDEEVLPMLTLDDLKDMGINAVGSRRKMYCAIQKLRRG